MTKKKRTHNLAIKKMKRKLKLVMSGVPTPFYMDAQVQTMPLSVRIPCISDVFKGHYSVNFKLRFLQNRRHSTKELMP